MIKNWNGQRKDRNDMMDLLWIIGGVIVCGACVGGYLVYRKNSRLRQQEEADEQRRADAERQRRAAQKKAEAERAALVDEYCRVMQKLDGYQDREVYRRCTMWLRYCTIQVLGMIPKKNIPMYAEFYEGRHFTPGEETVTEYRLGKQVIPFGSNLLFRCEELPELILGCELCEDLWVAEPPSTSHALMAVSLTLLTT